MCAVCVPCCDVCVTCVCSDTKHVNVHLHVAQAQPCLLVWSPPTTHCRQLRFEANRGWPGRGAGRGRKLGCGAGRRGVRVELQLLLLLLGPRRTDHVQCAFTHGYSRIE